MRNLRLPLSCQDLNLSLENTSVNIERIFFRKFVEKNFFIRCNHLTLQRFFRKHK